MQTYDELAKLALFCANQARIHYSIKDAAREAWRLAVEEARRQSSATRLTLARDRAALRKPER